jgi:ABC-type branched-subunit amino acid transport system ATPase component
VIFDDHDITRLGPAARARRGIGRTFQHPAVFERLRVDANVALAVTRSRRRAVTERADAALATAGLTEHAGTVVGDLPYGLRRRLELAIALAAQPRLLLLDEPSAGLGPADVGLLVTAIGNLPGDVTVLLIDHQLDLVWGIADTVTVLDHGQHVATGAPDEIRANPDVQAAYLGTNVSAGTPGRKPPSGETSLRIENLSVGYHGAPVLHELSCEASAGEVVAILGRNGAGKTTLINSLAGLVPRGPGSSIEISGSVLPGGPAHRAARAGIAVVPQGRRLFGLTVGEHLAVAAATCRRERHWTRERVLELLPSLRQRLGHKAALLSGGEQQMLALARALLSNPRVLLLDEPGVGLAPAIIEDLAGVLRSIAGEGVTVLIAEQNLHLALGLADRVLVLERGRIALTATAAELPEPAVRRRLDTLLGVVPG